MRARVAIVAASLGMVLTMFPAAVFGQNREGSQAPQERLGPREHERTLPQDPLVATGCQDGQPQDGKKQDDKQDDKKQDDKQQKKLDELRKNLKDKGFRDDEKKEITEEKLDDGSVRIGGKTKDEKGQPREEQYEVNKQGQLTRVKMVRGGETAVTEFSYDEEGCFLRATMEITDKDGKKRKFERGKNDKSWKEIKD